MAEILVLVLYAFSLLTAGIVLLATELSADFRARATGGSLLLRLQPLGRFLLTPFILPILLPALGIALGNYLVMGTRKRYNQVISNTENDERIEKGRQEFDEHWDEKDTAERNRLKDPKVREKEYNGLIGFFHPFCNAGGGGERVLWAAIRATQQKYPNAICVVYTGDHDADKSEILGHVKKRFNIPLKDSRIHFLYLSTRHLVLASTWPRFTLLGQSIGSLILLLDAFTLVVPDVFVDTMGYGFVLAMAKWMVPSLPIGAYVHYPTISTDMLATLDDDPDAEVTHQGVKAVGNRGLNAGSGKGLRGQLKRRYWRIFAWLYSWAGGHVDVVMTNSTWTQNHIKQLWGPARTRQGRVAPIEVNFPPCPVDQLMQGIEVSKASENTREKTLLYVAQFRPEKNHELIITAFAKMLKEDTEGKLASSKLLLIGTVRDGRDEKFIYKLRLLAHELGLAIPGKVEIVQNASWTEILNAFRKSSVGVNGMWNEHFGISVVEAQAAGLISVVNDSGGPKLDIVVDYEGGPTGFHASTAAEYADGFAKALSLSKDEALKMRIRARSSAKRFSEEAFDEKWLIQLGRLVHMEVYPAKPATSYGQWLLGGMFAMLSAQDLLLIFAPVLEKHFGNWR